MNFVQKYGCMLDTSNAEIGYFTTLCIYKGGYVDLYSLVFNRRGVGIVEGLGISLKCLIGGGIGINGRGVGK